MPTEANRLYSTNFSAAFRQMCGMVAIGQTREQGETLRRLILHCVHELGGDGFSRPEEVVSALSNLYGLSIPKPLAEGALDKLETDGDLQRPSPDENVRLNPLIRSDIDARIRGAEELEQRVKQRWLEEIEREWAIQPQDYLWEALRAYLFRAFRRHGIQAAALLDPTLEIPPEDAESLSFLLDDAVESTVPDTSDQRFVKSCLSRFLANAGESDDRAIYLTQLADGAFSYYSLTVAPEVAANLRENLRPLKLFLDTNFLFGLVNLGENVSADTANELISAIQQYDFPYSVEYHEVTSGELRSSLANHESQLRSWNMSSQLARAALKSPYLSGIVRDYLTKFLATGIDIDTFFRPFRHVDVVLEGKGVKIFRPTDDRMEQRSNLYAKLDEYLKSKGRPKRYELVMHDATILDYVRHLRAGAPSTLDAGALLITYDYHLYMFDWSSSRKRGQLPCVVLPNTFWQILRPFVPDDHDFTRSFAETFALPEFRTISSDSAAACSKMITILAAYEEIPEDTAAKLLSNDLLLDRLRRVEADTQIEELVNAEIAKENVALYQKVESLREELARNRVGRNDDRDLLEETFRENARLSLALKELEASDKSQGVVEDRGTYVQEDVVTQPGKWESDLAEAKVLQTYRGVAAISSSLLLVISGWFALDVMEWSWLEQHPKMLALKLLASCTIVLATLGVFFPDWRKVLWLGSGGSLVALYLLFSLL